MIQIPNDWFSHEFSSVWGPSDVALQRPRREKKIIQATLVQITWWTIDYGYSWDINK